MREALKVTIDTKTVTSISIEKDYKNRDVMELKTVHGDIFYVKGTGYVYVREIEGYGDLYSK